MAGAVFLYPSEPSEIADTAHSGLETVGAGMRRDGLFLWEDKGQPGSFISSPVAGNIDECDYLVADLTSVTFNISYLLGYAIGREKPLLLLKNRAISANEAFAREVGLFGPLTTREYSTGRDLAGLLTSASEAKKIVTPTVEVNQKAPVYVLLPKVKSDLEVHLISHIKKAKLFYRTFDAEESGTLSVFEGMKNIIASYGVIVPLLPESRKDSESHNIRGAFAAGLSAALEKDLLLLQFGKNPVPPEYGIVHRTTNSSQIKAQIAEFAPTITGRLQSDMRPAKPASKTLLAKLNLGATAAENEMATLEDYYLETDEYQRAARGEAQIVAGRKGSGKTALFVKLRNNLRRNRQTVVLDLKPEGFQLLKLKDIILTYMEKSTREHTISAFWEYLLLLEICHKILANDKELHLTNHTLTEQYQEMAVEYKSDA